MPKKKNPAQRATSAFSKQVKGGKSSKMASSISKDAIHALTPKTKRLAKEGKAKIQKEINQYRAMQKGASPAERAYLNQAIKQAQKAKSRLNQGNLQRFGNQSEMQSFISKQTPSARRGINFRKKQIAKRVLSSRHTSAKLYGATESIWHGLQGEDRDRAIMEFFEKKNLYDVMLELEEKTGVSFLDMDGESETYYNEVVLAIGREILMMELGNE